MSLARAVAHNTAVQIGGKAVSTLLGLVAVAIMTRSLGLEQFGWYITATGFLQFVGILSDFGFTVTTSNLLAEPTFVRSKILAVAFSWRLITALVFQGLAPIIFLFFPYPAPIKLAVAITSLSFFALALNQVFIGYCREQLRLALPVTAEVLGRVVLVASVALIAWRQYGFLAFMGAITLASVIATAYLWARIGRIPLNFDRVISRVLFQKMWPTAIAVIGNAVYLQGDRLILPLFAPQAAVGLYGASYRIIDILIQIGALVMGTIMPLITYAWSRGLRAEFERRAALGLNLTLLMLLPLVGGLVALATPILALVAGAEFKSGGPLLAALSLSVVGVSLGLTFGHLALALNRQKQVLWIYLSDAALALTGYLIFIPRFGVWGAVGVTIASEFYAGIMLMAVTLLFVGWRPPLLTSGKIVLASLAMTLAVYLAQPLPLWLSILGGGLLYVALILALKVITPGTLKEIMAPSPTPSLVAPL